MLYNCTKIVFITVVIDNYKDMIGQNLKKQVTWLWPRPFYG